MTILVERQAPALLAFVTPSQSSPSSDLSAAASPFVPPSCILRNSEYTGKDECLIVDAVPDVTKQQVAPSLFKHRPSLCSTLSTSSISSFDSEDYSYVDDNRRGVSFAPQLVTDVWTREYTLPEDVPKLFYSREQTQAFRRQYHAEERERELSLKEEAPISAETTLSAADETRNGNNENGNCYNGNGINSRRHISRVVIVHDNKLETFFDNDSDVNDDDSRLYSVLPETPRSSSSSSSPSFFDNDSFWSGSLTWY